MGLNYDSFEVAATQEVDGPVFRSFDLDGQRKQSDPSFLQVCGDARRALIHRICPCRGASAVKEVLQTYQPCMLSDLQGR